MATEELAFTFNLGQTGNRRLGHGAVRSSPPQQQSQSRPQQSPSSPSVPTTTATTAVPTSAEETARAMNEFLENILSGESDGGAGCEDPMTLEAPRTPDAVNTQPAPPPPPPQSVPLHQSADCVLPGDDEDEEEDDMEGVEEPSTPVMPAPTGISATASSAPAPAPAPVPTKTALDTTIEMVSRAYMNCAKMEAHLTSQVFESSNLHPSLSAEKVLELLDDDPTTNLTFPFMLSAEDYLERAKEHTEHLAIYSLSPALLRKLIVERMDQEISERGSESLDHFPLLSILLSGALPSFETVQKKADGLEKLSAFGDFIDPVNLISKFAAITVKTSAVEAQAITKARAKADAAAKAAAPQPPSQPTPTNSFIKKLLARRSQAASTATAPESVDVTKLTPSISPAMMEETAKEMIREAAVAIRDANPTLLEVIISYYASGGDFSALMVESLFDGDKSSDINPENGIPTSLEPFARPDEVKPKCWIPFDKFDPKYRTAVIIYFLLNVYTTLVHQDSQLLESRQIESFSPLSIQAIASKLTMPNPISELFETTTTANESAPPKSIASSVASAKKTKSVSISVPTKEKAAASRKRKRSASDEESANEADAETIVAATTPTETTATPKAKRAKVAGSATKNTKSGKVDPTFFKISEDGNTVSYQPPETASDAVKGALTSKPQAIRKIIDPYEALVDVKKSPEEENDVADAFNVAIDSQKNRLALGAPKDFTLVFTDPRDNDGDSRRYGTLQVTFVHYTDGQTGRGDKKNAVGTAKNSTIKKTIKVADSDSEDDDSSDSDEDGDDGDEQMNLDENYVRDVESRSTFDWTYYKPLYSNVFNNGGVSTANFVKYFNRFLRTMQEKFPQATTLSKSMIMLAKFNDGVFARQGDYNGALVVIAHTDRSRDTREPAPKVFFPQGRKAKNASGKKMSYAHLEDNDNLNKMMEGVLRHSVRCYKPRVDAKTGTWSRSYISAHAQEARGLPPVADQTTAANDVDPRIYYVNSVDGCGRVKLITADKLPQQGKCVRFSAVCLCCNGPKHLDDYAFGPKVKMIPAYPLIRCAGCSPAFRKIARSGLKTRFNGFCPHH